MLCKCLKEFHEQENNFILWRAELASVVENKSEKDFSAT